MMCVVLWTTVVMLQVMVSARQRSVVRVQTHRLAAASVRSEGICTSTMWHRRQEEPRHASNVPAILLNGDPVASLSQGLLIRFTFALQVFSAIIQGMAATRNAGIANTGKPCCYAEIHARRV